MAHTIIDHVPSIQLTVLSKIDRRLQQNNMWTHYNIYIYDSGNNYRNRYISYNLPKSRGEHFIKLRLKQIFTRFR